MNIQNTPSALAAPSSYHDFAGLAALKGQVQNHGQSEQAIRKVAQQFEASFIQEMMKPMRQSSIKSDLLQSDAADTFEGMFDKEVAMQVARRGGMGVADMLVKHMSQMINPVNINTPEPKAHSLEPAPAKPISIEAKPHVPSAHEYLSNRVFPLNRGDAGNQFQSK